MVGDKMEENISSKVFRIIFHQGLLEVHEWQYLFLSQATCQRKISGRINYLLSPNQLRKVDFGFSPFASACAACGKCPAGIFRFSVCAAKLAPPNKGIDLFVCWDTFV